MAAAGEIDALVVGAGVVGLATAAELAAGGLSVICLERHDGPGRETSSRNSEVIHAGIYYPVGSLRAQLCVEGNALLYQLCERDGVEHRQLGKLIVADRTEQLGELEALLRRGMQNGARSLRLVQGAELRQLEPSVRAVAGIWSPSTGIVDSHGLIKALEARFRAHGGEVLYQSEVIAVEQLPSGYRAQVGAESLDCRIFVNAAGLQSDRLARMAGVDSYQLHWCKGDYFAVRGGKAANLVEHLVYPLPGSGEGWLGVHVTRDLGGAMKLGPDATYVERDAPGLLQVDAGKAEQFCRAARRYLPDLTLNDLSPDQAGIRPKLQGPGDPYQDFVIQEESASGCPGLINLVGIDSPGLTACLAIARRVWHLVHERCYN